MVLFLVSCQGQLVRPGQPASQSPPYSVSSTVEHGLGLGPGACLFASHSRFLGLAGGSVWGWSHQPPGARQASRQVFGDRGACLTC